jgi:SAM-dependent methyltransferase
VERADEQSAERVHGALVRGWLERGEFRGALEGVPPLDRDAWLDLAFGIDEAPEDGPELPRGCVPYLPCPVAELLSAIRAAEITEGDVFVDLGSGLGRTALLVQLLTGAATIGIEVQPALVQRSRELAARLHLARFSVLEGDAAQLVGSLGTGTVFFLYCPFSGARLEQALDALRPLAQTRCIRICSVDLPLPARPWLAPVPAGSERVSVFETTPG